MAEAGPSGASLKSVVDKAVAAALAKAGPSTGKRKAEGAAGGLSAVEKRRKLEEAQVCYPSLYFTRADQPSLGSSEKYDRKPRQRHTPIVSLLHPLGHYARTKLRAKVMMGTQSRRPAKSSGPGKGTRKGKWTQGSGKGFARQRPSSSALLSGQPRNRSQLNPRPSWSTSRSSAANTTRWLFGTQGPRPGPRQGVEAQQRVERSTWRSALTVRDYAYGGGCTSTALNPAPISLEHSSTYESLEAMKSSKAICLAGSAKTGSTPSSSDKFHFSMRGVFNECPGDLWSPTQVACL